MDCKRASALIMKYLDDELTDVEEREMIAHMEKCSACRLEFQWMKETIASVEELADFEAPKELEFEIMKKIDVDLYHRQSGVQKLWRVSLLSVLMAIGSAGWYFQYGNITQQSGLQYILPIAKMLSLKDLLSSLVIAVGIGIGNTVLNLMKFLEALSSSSPSRLGIYLMMMVFLVGIFISTQYVLMKLIGEYSYKGGRMDEK